MSKALDDLAVYMPIDRRLALAQGKALPERVHGAAIFADIDGFTSLTDQLLQELGPQRGAEELTLHLNRVYDAVIDVLHEYGASVIAFAGDAVTSWIDGDDGLRATACALAMRQAMTPFSAVETPDGSTITLTIKVVISVGCARRYQVGDPEIRLLDALAGETLVRLGRAEALAGTGDIVLDGHSLAGIAEDVSLHEHRSEPESGIAGGVVRKLNTTVESAPWPKLPDGALLDDHIRPWVHAPVYARMQRSLGDFLAELRPTVALFLRFGGIDYDADETAGDKLDAYIRWVQRVADRFEGALIDLNIGDKGSYLYINFGALLAHEDSSARACSAALALLSPPDEFAFVDPVQIGISRGRMRVGAYGGRAHRTYGALGAEVNMAARLMMAAAPGEILVSQHAAWAAGSSFVYEEMPPLRAKGREQLLTAYRLVEARSAQTVRFDFGVHEGPLVGRENELSEMATWLEEAKRGRGKVVAIRGDAGIGKSRFAVEVSRIAETYGFDLHGGACESYGVYVNYLVWQPIWRNLLGIDADLDAGQQAALALARLETADPAFVPRAPLVGALFNQPFVDNELTAAMDAKTRKAALESLLVDYLRVDVRRRPLLLLLEDCHWLDPLSQDLLDALALAVADLPLLVLLTFRDPELTRLNRSLSHRQSNYVEILLPLFNEVESARHIRLMLEHLYGGDQADELIHSSEHIIELVADKAEGNPFYIVELLTYLHERDISPDDSRRAALLDLPDSLHNLALSRVDRLGEHPASVLKVASMIGRTFHADWPHQVEPALGELATVLDSLEELTNRHMIRLSDALDEESGRGIVALVYLFRQTIIQDALYNSVPHQIRAKTHAAIGEHIETAYAERQEQMLDLLAHHYERSQVLDKRIEYLRRAGEAAQATFANEAAIDYYRRLLPLQSPSASFDTLIKLGDVLQLVGQWDEAAESYRSAQQAAEEAEDQANQIRARRSMGRLLYHEKPQDALRYLEEGLVEATNFDSQDVDISVAAFQIDIGWAHIQLGNLDVAMEALLNGLDGLPAVPSLIRGNALNSLSGIFRRKMDADQALAYAEMALKNSRLIPDLSQEQMALTGLAAVNYFLLHRWEESVTYLEQVARIADQVGDKRMQAALGVNLGSTYMKLGQADSARIHLQNGIALSRQSRLFDYEFQAQTALIELCIRSGDLDVASVQLEEADAILALLDANDRLATLQRLAAERELALGQERAALAQIVDALELAQQQDNQQEVAICQRVLGQVYLASDEPSLARDVLMESEKTLRDLHGYEAARSRFHLGRAMMALGDVAEGSALIGETRTYFEQVGAGFDSAELSAHDRIG